ncbi:MAG: hypothetical protein WA723_08855 [Pseudolabrys sp.]
MAEKKGLESAVEFTKHVMTLAGAGIAFIATIDADSLGKLQRFSLFVALVALGTSLAAGLFVWSRAERATGSAISSLPSSASIIVATEVNGFVIDAMRKIVSGAIATPASRSR